MSRIPKVLLYLGIIAISWIVVLSFPQTRTMFLAQSFRGGSEILPSAVPPPEPNFTELARRHPRSFSLRLAKVRQQMRLRQSRQYDVDTNIPDMPVVDEEGITREFELLAEDFPDSPLAVYALLAHSMTGMSPIRVGGRLGDPKSFEHEKKGIPSPERRGERDYTPEQWRQVIALCKKGQKVDPQNGIFDVFEAYWLFAEFQDEDGWKALERAVGKAEIKNYSLELGKQMMLAYREGHDRNLMWEEIEKYSLPFNFEYSFAANWRQFTRWLVWEGIKQQKLGNHARALEMYDQTFQLANKFKNSGQNLIDQLVAIALEALATSGPYYAGVRVDVPHNKNRQLYQSHRRNAAFEKYANEHGRSDIAEYGNIALKDYEAVLEMSDNNTTENLQKPFLWPAFTGFLLWRIDILLLWFLLGAAIIGILAAVVSKVLLRNDTRIVYTETDFWRGAVSFAALPASLILIAGYAVSFYREWSQGRYDSYIGMVTIDFLAHNQIAPAWMAFIGVMTPIIFGIAYCWHREVKDHQHSNAPKVFLWKCVLGVFGSLLFVIAWAALASGKLPFHLWTGKESLIDLFFITYLGVEYFTKRWTNIVYTAAFFVGLGIIIYLCNRFLQRTRIDDLKSTFADCAALVAQSSLRFIVLASVLYLWTLAIAIPIRAPVHHHEMIKATQGEMMFYRGVVQSTFKH